MDIRELYVLLRQRFGARSDPDTWWPVYHARTVPLAFERVVTNVLVTQSDWGQVRRAVDALDAADLLTARGLAGADEAAIADCVKPVGFQVGKAKCLKAIGAFVVARYGTEAAFCEGATREELLGIRGVGPETADRILLYTCGRLVWPVDTYCLRVLAHHKVIEAVPAKQAERRKATAAIKAMVSDQIPALLDDWRRMHALMQLEGKGVQ